MIIIVVIIPIRIFLTSKTISQGADRCKEIDACCVCLIENLCGGNCCESNQLVAYRHTISLSTIAQNPSFRIETYFERENLGSKFWIFKICKKIRVIFYIVTLGFTSVRKLGMIIGWLLGSFQFLDCGSFEKITLIVVIQANIKSIETKNYCSGKLK